MVFPLFTISFVYSLIVLLGALNFGYMMGFCSPTLPQFESDNWKLTTFESSAFSASSALFAIAGSYLAQVMAKYMSRKLSICIISAICTIWWGLLILTSKKLIWLGIAVRALIGLNVGASSAFVPMVVIELAPTEHVGLFANFNQVFIILGICIMYIVGEYAPWWSLCIIGAATCAVQACLIWVIPKTDPKKDDKTDHEKKNKRSVWQKEYIGKLSIGVVMMVVQQFSGANAFVSYVAQMFMDAGVDLKPGIASLITMLAQLLGVIVIAFLTDKVGRRLLWLVSCAGIFVALMLYAFHSRFLIANWMPILTLFLYMFFFGVAMGPIPWFVVTDLFPDDVRPAASSFITMSNWICAFAVIFLYNWMVEGITMFWTLIIFAIITLLGFIFGIVFVKDGAKENEESSSIEYVPEL